MASLPLTGLDRKECHLAGTPQAVIFPLELCRASGKLYYLWFWEVPTMSRGYNGCPNYPLLDQANLKYLCHTLQIPKAIFALCDIN